MSEPGGVVICDILVFMDNAYIFVDETGKADFTHESEYFCLSAIVINDNNRKRLKLVMDELKLKYFGAKGYVLHGSELKRTLRFRKKSELEFAKDLRKAVLPIGFFALGTITDKLQAKKGNWIKDTILEKSYSMILSNLIKFVMAKDYRGQIIAEASAHEQDLHLYRNFFKFMGNGIPRLSISSKDVKRHVTAVTYVTKQNEDCETQLVDLLAGVIPIKYRLMRGRIKESEVNEYDLELLRILDNKLFVANAMGKDKRKKELYTAISSYKKFP